MKQICKVLGYLHSKGIPHGDVSLDNVFLDDRGSVTIGDFNLNKCICDDRNKFIDLIRVILDKFAEEKVQVIQEISEFHFIRCFKIMHQINSFLY